MPSTYTLNNGIELIATGEQSGTWGATTNTNLTLLDTSLDGQVSIALGSAGSSGSPNSLPISEGTASNGRNRLITFTDSSDLGGTAFVQLTPNDAEKIVYVRNSLSGSRSILLFQGTYNASNDYEVPAGTTAVVFFNGAGSGAVAANVFNNAHFDALNVVGNATFGGTVTATGTSVFASLDISGDIDVDGTTNLDVVDIDGATNIDLADGVADNAYALTVKNQEATDDRSYGLLVHAGSTSTDKALVINDHDGSNALFYVTGAGDVGIQTTAPKRHLHINGGSESVKLQITNSTTGSSSDGDGFQIGIATNGTANIEQRENAGLNITTNNTTRMTIDASGNVGIGTGTSSIAKNLEIRTDAGDEGILVKSTGDTSNEIAGDANRTSANAALLGVTGKWNGTSVGQILFQAGADTTNKDDGFITFRTSSANNITERMRIDSSGNVGIGTSAPHDAGSNFNMLTLNGAKGGGIVFSDDDVNQHMINTTDDASLRFSRGSNLDSETMRIDSSGGVSIGTAANATGIHSNAKVLEISGGDGGDLIIGNNASSNIGAGAHIGAIAFKNIDTSPGTAPLYAGIRCEAVDTSGNMDLRFYTGTANLEADSPQLIINSNGSISTPTSGTNNTRLGENAGASLTSGANSNTLIGDAAGTSLTSPASFNVAIGHLALDADTKGDQSVAIGYAALSNQNFTTNGVDSNNTAVGFMAGITVTSGQSNTIIGSNAGFYLSTGNNNTFLGMQAGTGVSTNLLTGDRNIAIGTNAGFILQGAAAENVLIGAYAGDAITTGSGNVMIGDTAGSDADSNVHGSVFIGHNACGSGDCNDNNTIIGNNAGFETTGGQNVILGANAGLEATSTDDSVLIGYNAGASTSSSPMTGHDNVIIGSNAGSAVTGGRNVIIGKSAGATTTNLTSGTDNIFIGFQNKTNGGGTTNAICMGDSVTAQGDNIFTFGKDSTSSSITFGGGSIDVPSDERYKENIQTATAGLSFINDLRPVTFQWKKEKDVPTDHEAYVEGSDTRVMLSNGETNHGFIAQEVKAVIDAHSEIKDGFKMWSAEQREDAEGNPVENTRQRLAPSELIPMLVKAIQELSAKNDALEARIATLEGS